MQHSVVATNGAELRSRRAAAQRTGRKNGPPARSARSTRNTYRASTAITILILILLSAPLVYTWSTAALKEYRERKREVAQLQHQLATLKKENERLKKQRDALFTDEEIEKLARERFGLVKPGEKAYVVIMNDREENDGR